MLTELEAIKILNWGGVVAIPTETVYGLAARIDREEGLKQIFSIKERPFFDPLIVHVKSLEQAKEYCQDWGEPHQLLAEAFWPGPLTIVVKKNAKISDLITASLPTVGLRCPRHPVALNLLEQIDVPLAAPSANKFTKTSPTSPDHVRKSLPDVPILEGGECEVGIESTIIEIKKIEKTDQYELTLLRPGMIALSNIKKTLKDFPLVINNTGKGPLMPGQLDNHYRPDIPLIFLRRSGLADQDILLQINEKLNISIEHKIETLVELHLPQEAWLAARILYAELRRGGEVHRNQALLVREQEFMKTELWLSVLDRLKKASYLIL